MDNRPIHQIIRECFGLRKRNADRDNLPIGVKRSRDTLGEVFAKGNLNRGAEIGVKRGEFSEVLCKANPNIELYCVDLWAPASKQDEKYASRHSRYYDIAKRVLSAYNAELIQQSSMDALVRFPDNHLDFVYIDAAHDFDHCCPDIIFWSQKVRSGGIVACHDYYQFRHGGVIRAVEAYTASHRIDPYYVTYEIMPTVFWVKP